MIVVIGEILFDQFPDRSVLGGAPFNFAFHLKKMGLPVRFISRVGNDVLGWKILNFLERHGFNSDDIQKDPDHATGTVQVKPTPNGHTFHIAKNAAWDHLMFDDRLSKLIQNRAKLFYFGSLIQRTPSGKRLMEQVAALDLSGAIVFCDINLRQDEFSKKTIHRSLNLCTTLKLNREELAEIANGDIKDSSEFPQNALTEIRNTYGIDEIILTMGERGSLYDSGTHQYHMKALPPNRFVDSVGAGDAYAAVCAAGRIKETPMERTMEMASWFSGQICAIQGALPDDEAIYSKLKKVNTP